MTTLYRVWFTNGENEVLTRRQLDECSPDSVICADPIN